jgi:hypothetical protein
VKYYKCIKTKDNASQKSLTLSPLSTLPFASTIHEEASEMQKKMERSHAHFAGANQFSATVAAQSEIIKPEPIVGEKCVASNGARHVV